MVAMPSLSKQQCVECGYLKLKAGSLQGSLQYNSEEKPHNKILSQRARGDPINCVHRYKQLTNYAPAEGAQDQPNALPILNKSFFSTHSIVAGNWCEIGKKIIRHTTQIRPLEYSLNSTPHSTLQGTTETGWISRTELTIAFYML
jgi:hypothetical protein